MGQAHIEQERSSAGAGTGSQKVTLQKALCLVQGLSLASEKTPRIPSASCVQGVRICLEPS